MRRMGPKRTVLQDRVCPLRHRHLGTSRHIWRSQSEGDPFLQLEKRLDLCTVLAYGSIYAYPQRATPRAQAFH